jgi:hypothetical protein
MFRNVFFISYTLFFSLSAIPKLSNSNCIESLYAISEKLSLVVYELQIERI